MDNDDAFSEVMPAARMTGAFETVILYAKLENHAAMSEALARAIRERRATDPGIERSNVGGWHSDTDMLRWGGKAAAKLADTAVRLARGISHFESRKAQDVGWRVRMWANLSAPGGLNMPHTHPGNLWAAVYYVDMGRGESGEPNGGELMIDDPRFPMTLMRHAAFRPIGRDGQPQQPRVSFAPEAGDLVLFPAWARHSVSAHSGPGDRISIAMNLDAAL